MRADTFDGRMEGPDIALLDEAKHKVTIEVKSTSSPEKLQNTIGKAIGELETDYFSSEDPSKGFVWKMEEGEAEYGAKAAIAAVVCFDPSLHEITIEAVRIDVEVRNGEVIFSEKKIDLARGKLR